jgi:16S rRNA G966 N2-methylase RsmD
MSHAAFLSRKYSSVLYQDYNPLIVELVRGGLAGEYNYNRFKPEFITRERFEAEKTTNGYIATIWSYGNNPGKQYMFSRELEPIKHIAHDFVVFGKGREACEQLSKGCTKAVKSSDIHKRRMEFCAFFRKQKKRLDLQQLERLERLQQLERPLIEVKNAGYLDYDYQDGDIVYCDPPYEGTAEYKGSFNSQEFYKWAYNAEYPVWFSSYKISDKRFKLVFAKELRTTYGQGNEAVNYECLYANPAAVSL